MSTMSIDMIVHPVNIVYTNSPDQLLKILSELWGYRTSHNATSLASFSRPFLPG